MATLGELDVVVKAVGAKETKKDIDGVSGGLNDVVKGGAGDMSSMLGMSKKIASTMAIIVAAFTAATAALLLKIPLIQEMASAIGVLIDAIAFAMDEVLAPVLIPIINFIYLLSEKFSELPGPVKLFIAIMLIAAFALGTLTLALIGLLAIIAFVGAILIIVVVLAAIIAVIGLLVAAVMLAYYAWKNNWFGIRDTIKSVFDKIKGYWTSMKKWFFDAFGDELADIKKEWDLTWDSIASKVKAIISTVTSIIKAGLGVVKRIWEEDIGGIRNILTNAWDIIKTATKAVFDVIVSVIEIAINTIMTVIKVVLALIRGDWEAAWDYLKEYASGVIDAVVGIIDTIATALKGIANTVIDSLNSVIDSINSISVEIPDWVPIYGGDKFSPNIPSIPALERGGSIKETGMAVVHKGENIYNNQALADAIAQALGGAGGAGGNVEINLILDGYVLERFVVNILNRQMTNRGSM